MGKVYIILIYLPYNISLNIYTGSVTLYPLSKFICTNYNNQRFILNECLLYGFLVGIPNWQPNESTIRINQQYDVFVCVLPIQIGFAFKNSELQISNFYYNKEE